MNRFIILLVLLLFSSCIGKHKSDAQTAIVGEQKISSIETFGDTLSLNILKSKIFWKGTKMRGMGKHEGEINFKNGYFITENGKLKGGSFTIDMKSINVTDIPEHEPVPRNNLNTHLKSNDFFDVENYPTSSFQVTNIEKTVSDSLRVSGNLTIKGITKNIQFKALHQNKIFSAKFKFDRFQWNVAYAGNWADKTLVDKDIQLVIKAFIE